jgi:prepilin-type N-terminal cleavage/methylation domain-containing protein
MARATKRFVRETAGASSGFSLIEVLMAIALAGALILAANMFVLSMGELWGRGTDERMFEQHVRGVSRFLENLSRTAVPSGAEGDVFTMNSPKGYESHASPLLSFEVNEAPGVCVWPGRPLPRVVVWLTVNREDGLVLLWKSRLEEDFGEVAPRATGVSRFVSAVEYEYYDDGRLEWRREGTPIMDPGGEARLPGRVRLTFTRGETSRQVSIALPTKGAKVVLW